MPASTCTSCTTAIARTARAWACNEIGILLAERYDNRAVAAAAFNRACTLQFAAGCDNAAAIARDGMLRHDDPTAADYRFILRGSKGPIRDREPAELYARACELGWPSACGTLTAYTTGLRTSAPYASCPGAT